MEEKGEEEEEQVEVGSCGSVSPHRRALSLGALFNVVLGPFAKRGLAVHSQLSHLYKVTVDVLPRKIIAAPISNFSSILTGVQVLRSVAVGDTVRVG